MIDQKNCTIIIPHFGADVQQEYALNECLKSLRETTTSPIILAINGEKCGLRDKHKELLDGLSIVELTEQGQCRAVNAVAASVGTPYIFITNDDMIYSPGWWENLTNNHEDANVICSNLVEPKPGAPPFLVYFAGGAGGDFDKQKWLNFAKMHREDSEEVGFNFPVLIKKELWDLIGGYDVAYDPWGSNGDSDLQAKIHLAGVLPIRNRRSIVYHFGQTSGTFNPANHDYWQKNWEYFKTKWGFDRQPTDDVWYSKNIINYDKLIYRPDWMDHYAQRPRVIVNYDPYLE